MRGGLLRGDVWVGFGGRRGKGGGNGRGGEGRGVEGRNDGRRERETENEDVEYDCKIGFQN